MLLACLVGFACIAPLPARAQSPIRLHEQGSFLAGGTVVIDAVGNTFHGNHVYVQYQIPAIPGAPERYPLVMWHGGAQFSKTWETTSDGREGFQNIFVRRNYPVYNIDEPATGRSGRITSGASVDNQGFSPRLAPSPVGPNTQSPSDFESALQRRRQSTDGGPLPLGPALDAMTSDAVAALFDRTGPAILVTHSASGNPGWLTAIKNPNVKAIIAYEVTAKTFPKGERPDLLPTFKGLPPNWEGPEIPLEDFLKLTRIPIRLIYGDIESRQPWPAAISNARKFAEVVNRHGGNAKVIHLPTDAGMFGNTHFLMSDLNAIQVADHMEQVLREIGLDKRGGPKPSVQGKRASGVITVEEQGSFFVGPVAANDAGTSFFYGDDAYVQYQIPSGSGQQNASARRQYPLVLWHGENQSGKTWESTPDGREGFQSILLRRGFATYIIDQPRRARGGRGMQGTTIPSAATSLAQGGEAALFKTARLGVWNPPNAPSYFPGVQFPKDAESRTQFFRQQTPNTGVGEWEGADPTATTNAVSELFNKIGPGVLITHSGSGGPGWLAATKSANIKGIISYEPLRFLFPTGELPPPVGNIPMVEISAAEFAKLTRIPIQLVYGDNISKDPSSAAAFANAQAFVKAIKRHGGDAELLHLPTVGVRGNTHFPFSDLNNGAVADQLSKFLHKRALDKLVKAANN
jgi:hypothetical protein